MSSRRARRAGRRRGGQRPNSRASTWDGRDATPDRRRAGRGTSRAENRSRRSPDRGTSSDPDTALYTCPEVCWDVGVIPDRAFRAEAAAWLAQHAPAMRVRLDAAPDDRAHFDAGRAWQRELFDGRWAGISWPLDYGGRGGTPAQATIFAEEQARFAVSSGFVGSTIGMVGPTLMRYGN